MKDQIIQITDTFTDSGDGQTYGLSELGKLYRLEILKTKDNKPIRDSKGDYKMVWNFICDSPTYE